MTGYYDLGHYSRPVQASSADAQLWFDRGLNWTYGFHHEEALNCFEKALQLDPNCAMAHWGIAYGLGPNYNVHWVDLGLEERAEYITRGRAALAAAKGQEAEAALLAALALRIPNDPEIDDFGPFNEAYATAMRQVHTDYADDLDICALFAEALMNCTPWLLWDLKSGQPAEGAHTAEAVAVLESAFGTLDGAMRHPGLLHLYIHLMEMSPTPEKALRAGDALTGLVPDAGHLQHMASHVDVLCGHYENVVRRNWRAWEADKKYLAAEGPQHFYTIYICHDLHFVIYGAMFLGQMAPALEAARILQDMLTPDVVEPSADWIESYVPMRQHALIRFGRWEAIKATELPDDQELFCFTTAVIHYSKTVAYAATGEIEKAEAKCKLFRQAKDKVPETRMLFNNTCNDILDIAEAMLEGELSYRKGEYDDAFAHLRRSVDLDDNLPYEEPWGWMQPTRHALGALLLEQDRVKEAEAVYRADLGFDHTLARAGQNPDNVWSLHGLHECLMREGKKDEARLIKPRLDLANARADVPIRASCFCRMQSMAG